MKKLTKADNTHSIHYHAVLSQWPKGIGPKPTNDMFAVAHATGIGTGKKHALACAMYQRENGATDFEVREAARHLTNWPLYQQTSLFNYVRRRVEAGIFTRDMNAGSRVNPENKKAEAVWHVTLSKQGEAEIAQRLPQVMGKVTAKADVLKAKARAAAKAKRDAAKASKPRKAKVAAAIDAVLDPATPDTAAHDAAVTLLTDTQA